MIKKEEEEDDDEQQQKKKKEIIVYVVSFFSKQNRFLFLSTNYIVNVFVSLDHSILDFIQQQ